MKTMFCEIRERERERERVGGGVREREEKDQSLDLNEKTIIPYSFRCMPFRAFYLQPWFENIPLRSLVICNLKDYPNVK